MLLMNQMEENDLNEELLEAAAQEHAIPQETKEPKRNSKQALIDKIIQISERDDIPLVHSVSWDPVTGLGTPSFPRLMQAAMEAANEI